MTEGSPIVHKMWACVEAEWSPEGGEGVQAVLPIDHL